MIALHSRTCIEADRKFLFFVMVSSCGVVGEGCSGYDLTLV